MMNVIAIGLLLSYLGAVVVWVPDPHLADDQHQHYGINLGFDHHTDSERRGILGSAKDALHKVADSGNHLIKGEEAPPASTMDAMKEKIHQGYERTVDGVESAKDTAKDTLKEGYRKTVDGVENAKDSTKDTLQQGYRKTVDGVGSAKDYAKDTLQEGYDKTVDGMGAAKDSAKDAMGDAYERTKQVGDAASRRIPSKDDAVDAASQYIPSREDALSYIPGREYGKEAVEGAKKRLEEAKQGVQRKTSDTGFESYIPAGGRDAMETLKRKLEDSTQQISSFKSASDGNDNDDSVVETLRRKRDEAAAFIPSKEDISSYTVEPLKGTVEGMKYKDEYKQKEDDGHVGDGYKAKFGNMIHGVKEKLTGGRASQGGDVLEKKVHEFCTWFGNVGGESFSSINDTEDHGAMGRMMSASVQEVDVGALRESYAYLMQSALTAIHGAREVFQKSGVAAGGEWKSKFLYLSDSATRALERAMEVFDQTATEAGKGSMASQYLKQQQQRAAAAASHEHERGRKRHVGTLMKDAAVHTKQRLGATLQPLLRTVYLATFSVVYGVTLWMTFFSGHLLSKAVPRQQLGFLQSKLFPAYLRLADACLGLCILLHVLLQRPWSSSSSNSHDKWQLWNLALALAASLVNTFVVEPRATKTMFQKLKVEKEEGRGQSSEEDFDEVTKARLASIDSKFVGLHQWASCLNLANLACLTWHLWYLANRLMM